MQIFKSSLTVTWGALEEGLGWEGILFFFRKGVKEFRALEEHRSWERASSRGQPWS